MRQRHMGCCRNMFRLKRYFLKTRKAKIGKKNLIQKNEFWAEQNTRAGAKQMGPCRASDDRGDDLGGKRGPQPPTDHIVYMKVKVISWKNDLSYTQGVLKQGTFWIAGLGTDHGWTLVARPQPPTDHIVYIKWNWNQNFCIYITYQHVMLLSLCMLYIYCIFYILYVFYIIHKMELKANRILGGRRGSNHQQITSWKKFLYVPCIYNLT